MKTYTITEEQLETISRNVRCLVSYADERPPIPRHADKTNEKINKIISAVKASDTDSELQQTPAERKGK